jgi:hypothetical protein
MRSDEANDVRQRSEIDRAATRLVDGELIEMTAAQSDSAVLDRYLAGGSGIKADAMGYGGKTNEAME